MKRFAGGRMLLAVLMLFVILAFLPRMAEANHEVIIYRAPSVEIHTGLPMYQVPKVEVYQGLPIYPVQPEIKIIYPPAEPPHYTIIVNPPKPADPPKVTIETSNPTKRPQPKAKVVTRVETKVEAAGQTQVNTTCSQCNVVNNVVVGGAPGGASITVGKSGADETKTTINAPVGRAEDSSQAIGKPAGVRPRPERNAQNGWFVTILGVLLVLLFVFGVMLLIRMILVIRRRRFAGGGTPPVMTPPAGPTPGSP